MLEKPPRSPEHHRALDGVRFMAFLLVFFFHALQYSSVGNWPLIRFGYLGVPIFFVLSGFLIGRILLELREAPGIPLAYKLKRFYLRRSLRVFPVYYLFIGILVLLGSLSAHPDSRIMASIPWHLSYLTNVRSFQIGMQNIHEGHFWSLAVEEHFYLLAPLFVLLMHPQRLSRWLASTIVTVALVRAAIYLSGSARDFWVLSPMQFDLLGIGIATAIVEQKGAFLGITPAHLRFLGIGSAGIFLLYIAQFYYPIPQTGALFAALGSLSLGLSTSAMILYLWTHPTSLPSVLLGVKPLAYLGQISYGLYLFHPNCIGWMSKYLGPHNFLSTLAGLALTLLVAMISWQVFEKPINNLKNRFSYAPERKKPEAHAAIQKDEPLSISEGIPSA